MSRQIPATKRDPFDRSDFSLNEQYTYSPDLEAQDLLSQFITTSQELQKPRKTELVVHGHTPFRGTRRGRPPKSESKPKKHSASANDTAFAHKTNTALQSSNSFRRRTSPDRSSAPYKMTSSFEDSSSPSTASSTKENQPSRLSGDRPRRSIRQKSGPSNYYQKVPFYPSESENDENKDPGVNGQDSATILRSDRLRSSHSLPSRPASRQPPQPPQPQAQRAKRTTRPRPNWQSYLHPRELGRPVNRRMHSDLVPDLRLHKSWKGASNDVIVSSWSPDGTRFVAGATAQCDEHNMEYNRGNNLVVGDLVTNSLKELPDHWVPCPSGRSNQNMTDGRLFMSVTAVQWFEDLFISASYDNTVKLWDATRHANTRCLKSLHHSSKVQVMSRSPYYPNMLATGSQSIGLWDIDSESYTALPVVGPYNRRGIDLSPTSLAWGTLPATKNLLLAGMTERDAEDYGTQHSGLLAMWEARESTMEPRNLVPNSQNVFDIKWHPSLPIFATANPLGPQRNLGSAKDARSVVRVYMPPMKTCSVEFDCPALDINDVTFCPFDPNYVTASCTDGGTYVWDRRRPDGIVHRLQHDPPLNQMDENVSREQADVGVRFAAWASGMDQFYTGASDGVLKRWNILQAPEDALVDDVASFPEEIMSGTFSEDKSNLLIGDCAGGVHVLSSSPFPYDKGDQKMRFEAAPQPKEKTPEEKSDPFSDQKLERHPIYGVGQGPSYSGPFAAWARPVGTRGDQIAQTPLEQEVQAQQLDGPPARDRVGLDDKSRAHLENQQWIARIRNVRRKIKRKRHERRRHEKHKANRASHDSREPGRDTASGASNFVNLVSDEEPEVPKPQEPKPQEPKPPEPKKVKKHKKSGAPQVIRRVEEEPGGEILVIDLTGPDEGAGREEFYSELEEDFWWPDSKEIDANIRDDI